MDVRAEEGVYTIARRALAEGNWLHGTGRIVGVDKDTICQWLDRGGRDCRAVITYLFDKLHIGECQWPEARYTLDEWWGLVRKQEGHLTPTEKVLMSYADA